MSTQTYSGSFVVVNQTGSNLSNVSVQFKSSIGVAISSAATLPKDTGTTIFELPPVVFEGASSNTDNWMLSFVTLNDATSPAPVRLSLGNVNCDFTSANVGGVVRVELYQSSYDIIMPISGSKQGNKYLVAPS